MYQLDFVNFIDILTTMSNHIEKHYIYPRYLKTISRDITLELILQNPIEMAFCYYYKNKKFIYLFYFIYSDCCSKYIRNNQFYCDIRGLSIFQLYKIITQHSKIESELI